MLSSVEIRRRVAVYTTAGVLVAFFSGLYSGWLIGLKGGYLLHSLVHVAEFLIAMATMGPVMVFAYRTRNRFHKALAFAAWLGFGFLTVYVRVRLNKELDTKVFDTLPLAWTGAPIFWVGILSQPSAPAEPSE